MCIDGDGKETEVLDSEAGQPELLDQIVPSGLADLLRPLGSGLMRPNGRSVCSLAILAA